MGLALSGRLVPYHRADEGASVISLLDQIRHLAEQWLMRDNTDQDLARRLEWEVGGEAAASTKLIILYQYLRVPRGVAIRPYQEMDNSFEES